jgi:hypothetical protein
VPERPRGSPGARTRVGPLSYYSVWVGGFEKETALRLDQCDRTPVGRDNEGVTSRVTARSRLGLSRTTHLASLRRVGSN